MFLVLPEVEISFLASQFIVHYLRFQESVTRPQQLLNALHLTHLGEIAYSTPFLDQHMEKLRYVIRFRTSTCYDTTPLFAQVIKGP